MKTIITPLILSIISTCSFSKNKFTSTDELYQFCQSNIIGKTTNLSINILPPQYNESLSSAQIKEISQSKMQSKELGLFRSENKIMVDLSYSIEFFIDKQKNVHTCSYPNNLNVQLELNSIIYLAKEILNFPCTKNRTIIHENQHFKFQTDVLSRNKENIIQSSNEILLAPASHIFNFSFNSTYIKDWYANYYQLQQNQFNQSIEKEILSKAKNLHNTIDSEENYIREKNICPKTENNQLDILLFK